MNLTYNPILGRTEVARRWFRSASPSPELGTAHVLIRTAAEPIVVWHGHPGPVERLGEHRRYVIDVANHRLSFTVRAASAEAVFPFAVRVDLACRVLNPLTIARDNVQDMTAALLPSLSREIRDTAARFAVLRPTDAARAIEMRLSSAHPSPDVELGGYSVTVEPVNTQGVVEAKQELGVQELRRKEMRDVSHGSPEEQIAQLLATNNGDVREVLEYLSSERNTEAEIKLKALQIAMGGNLEDMDVAEVHRTAFGNLFGGKHTGFDGKRESMRERVERRTKAAIESRPVVSEAAEPASNDKPAGALPDNAPADKAPADKAPSAANGSSGAEPSGDA
ncbi:hypothetical protein M8542_02910 [Amycolatopsis sp. OK19-0408]|uniref:Uncharacterized protein n=1 Tax=Amycolatopsis iheyensis TaxID=2945988 RepID=A0A9X2N7Q4_9PSEU|nr:hypothetical protein [Amycolatopsis iheyensis]MCR6481759.1 hypothetical protein [Amycolatopsis iheyensis]